MRTKELSKRKIFTIFAILAAVWLLLDQLTKTFLSDLLHGADPITAVPGVLDLVLVHNRGAAWGLFGGATAALVVLSIAVCAFMVIFLLRTWQQTNILVVIGASLVFAGGIGNMIDRLVFGYVIDFISLAFIDFPVFNIADIGVTCGMVLFLIGLIVSERKSER